MVIDIKFHHKGRRFDTPLKKKRREKKKKSGAALYCSIINFICVVMSYSSLIYAGVSLPSVRYPYCLFGSQNHQQTSQLTPKAPTN